MPSRHASVEAQLASRLESGEEAVLATVIRTDGEPPSHQGAKLLFDREGPVAGTLGCNEFDAAAVADAPGLLDSGRTAVHRYAHDLGSIEVLLEPYAPAPTLVIVGSTPVGRALAVWAADLGFRVLHLDEGESLPAALGPEIYLIHTNHDAPDLPELLEAALRHDPAPRYVGLMGSRRHTGHHLDALARRGFQPAELDRIQSPVGIDIGAQTPEEIALSMLAGLVAIRRERTEVRWLDAPRSS